MLISLFRAATLPPPLHPIGALSFSYPPHPEIHSFISTMKPLSPTLARPRLGRTQAPLILDREALRASTHTLYHSDDLSFPYPIPTSPSPIFNTCLLLTLYVTYVNLLISLACHAAPARFSPLGLPAESCRTKRCLQLVCSTLLFESIFLLLDPGGNPYPCYPRSTRTPGR